MNDDRGKPSYTCYPSCDFTGKGMAGALCFGESKLGLLPQGFHPLVLQPFLPVCVFVHRRVAACQAWLMSLLSRNLHQAHFLTVLPMGHLCQGPLETSHNADA